MTFPSCQVIRPGVYIFESKVDLYYDLRHVACMRHVAYRLRHVASMRHVAARRQPRMWRMLVVCIPSRFRDYEGVSNHGLPQFQPHLLPCISRIAILRTVCADAPSHLHQCRYTIALATMLFPCMVHHRHTHCRSVHHQNSSWMMHNVGRCPIDVPSPCTITQCIIKRCTINWCTITSPQRSVHHRSVQESFIINHFVSSTNGCHRNRLPTYFVFSVFCLFSVS